MVTLRNLSYKKRLYKKVSIRFDRNFCYIKGFLITSKFRLKQNKLFFLSSNIFLVHKKYIRTFFYINLDASRWIVSWI